MGVAAREACPTVFVVLALAERIPFTKQKPIVLCLAASIFPFSSHHPRLSCKICSIICASHNHREGFVITSLFDTILLVSQSLVPALGRGGEPALSLLDQFLYLARSVSS